MFLKQTSYKPRSNSQSSQGSNSGGGGGGSNAKDAAVGAPLSQSPPKDDSKPVSAGIAGRRRSSATAFGGLNTHKRGSSGDETAAAKKASWAEQRPGGQGIIGGMWNTFTKGS